MEQKNRIKNKSHKGSTLMMVLVAISFITIIGAVTVLAAYTNLTLKKYNEKNKQSFYTAESVVDEIYTGVGMTAMDNLSSAYSYVLSHMEVTTTVGGIEITAKMEDDEANEKLQKKYIANLMEFFGGKDSIGTPYFSESDMSTGDSKIFMANDDVGDGKTVCNNTISKLNAMIKNDHNAKVSSISSVRIKYDSTIDNGGGYQIVIKDANIKYIHNAQGFFSEVTVDFVIDYPSMNVIFNTDRLNSIKAFKDYSLIATDAVKFETGSTSTSSGYTTVYGGIYGGGSNDSEGIVFTNSNVSLSSGVFVSGGNITIKNTPAGMSNVAFSNSDIWGSNIIVSTTLGKKPLTGINNSLYVDDDSSIFVNDDLQINSGYTKVAISGNYWGYGIGNGAYADTHNKSSALIVNGKASELNMSGLKNLLLSGKAYIVYNSTQLAATAESLALKGNQRYYVIPDKYLKATYTDEHGNVVTLDNIVQPMNPGYYKNLKYELKDAADFAANFFGAKYLDTSVYFMQQDIGGKNSFAYMKFKNNASANSYLMCLLDETYFENEFPGANQDIMNSRNEMADETKKYLKSIESTTGISFASDAKIYSTALLLEYSSTTNQAGSGGNNSDSDTLKDSIGANAIESTENPLFVVNMYNNFTNRYSILQHILLSLEETDASGKFIIQTNDKPTVVYQDGVKYTIDVQSYNKTVFENIIDVEAVKNSPYKYDTPNADGEYVWVGDGNVSVPETAKYGVVVATGTVTVSSDFAGIVISDSVISVTKKCALTKDIDGYADTVDYIEKSNGGKLVQYFIPCQGEFGFGGYEDEDNENNNKISKLKYTDLVTYSNWRKTEGE